MYRNFALPTIMLLALVVTATAIQPRSVRADEQWAEYAANALADAEERWLQRDYTVAGDMVAGALRSDATAVAWMPVPAGPFVVVGACDQDCSNFELEVTDGSDRELGGDDGIAPLIEGRSDGGLLRVSVQMKRCSNQPCFWAVSVLSRGRLTVFDRAFDRTEHGRLRAGDLQLRSGELHDRYFFYGVAGQIVDVVLESEDFDPYLIVVGPDGQNLAENDDDDGSRVRSRIQVELIETGVHRLATTTYQPGERGDYTLRFRLSADEI
jgi:hypothetical protein